MVVTNDVRCCCDLKNIDVLVNKIYLLVLCYYITAAIYYENFHYRKYLCFILHQFSFDNITQKIPQLGLQEETSFKYSTLPSPVTMTVATS